MELIKNLDSPVFIVGMPRTGSKIYKNIINFNSKINISPEIFFLTPSWIRSDVVATTKKILGSLENVNPAAIAECVFGNHYFGTYFRDIGGDKNRLIELISSSDRSPKGLFEALLIFDAERNGKEFTGAKFPVHITKAQELFDWYPNARMIHINRNPLAIYNSQKRKHLKGVSNFISAYLTKIKIFLVTIISYRKSGDFFQRNFSKSNYILFQYEDLVTNPKEQVKRLCDFLKLPFSDEMLEPPSKDSSYTNELSTGIHAGSLDKWKDEVSWIEQFIFQLFTKNSFPVKRFSNK